MMSMEWISVEDNLPEQNQHVLCIDKFKEMYVARYERIPVRYAPGYLDIWDSEHCCGNERAVATHWMPLPKPPSLPVIYDEIAPFPSEMLKQMPNLKISGMISCSTPMMSNDRDEI